MARYNNPRIFYQPTMNSSSAVEVTHFKSLSWANRTNNNGTFELIIPIDSELPQTLNPAIGGYIRLFPGDTIMNIERKEEIFDDYGNSWYKLGGRTTQSNNNVVRIARNNGNFFRFVYDGVDSERLSMPIAGTPSTIINIVDILNSSVFEDNLGGLAEIVEDTAHEAFTWGTTVVGQPRISINASVRYVVIDRPIDVLVAAGAADALYQDPNVGDITKENVSYTTDEPFTTDDVPEISIGEASGPNGRMDRITYNGSWIKKDVTNDSIIRGTTYSWLTVNNKRHFFTGTSIQSVRKITLKTPQEYLAEMQALFTPESSGSMPANISRRTTFVEGEHAGYSFKLKSDGEVEKRYKVDFNIGDTIRVNDTRLDVVYTGVVSGAIETMDGNGYSVEIEIGTLGATLEQRVQRVI